MRSGKGGVLGISRCAAITALGLFAGMAGTSRSFGQEKTGEGITFTDARGQEHVNAKVLRVESGAAVIMSASGISKLPVAIIPPEVRRSLGVSDVVAQPAPEAKEEAPAPPKTPAMSQPALPATVASIDEVELTKIRGEMEKIEAELRGLENSSTLQKDDYNREFAAAKQRMDSQYDLAMQQYEKKSRNRRNPGEPPEHIDPNLDPEVAKIKARLDQYQLQIKERQKWLKDLGQRERQIADRIASVRRTEAEEATRQRMLALREEEQRRFGEERKRHQEMYAEGRRRVEEREEQAKEEGELRAREIKERLDSVVAECDAIMARGQGGDVKGAFLKLEALNADRRAWDLTGSDAAKRISGLAVDLFGLARRNNELAIATSCLRIAVSLDGQSAKLSEEVIRFFDEAAVLVSEGDFPALTHHLEFIKDVGLEGANLVSRKQHELSDLALDRGWQALRGLDFATAGSAIETARRLWDRNPRLGWLRTTVSGSFFVGILVGLFVIFKGVEKLYWWLNRG